MLFCEKCGQSIDDNMANCPGCGCLLNPVNNIQNNNFNSNINNINTNENIFPINTNVNNNVQNINSNINNVNGKIEYCINCGNEITKNMVSCPRCGVYNKNNNVPTPVYQEIGYEHSNYKYSKPAFIIVNVIIFISLLVTVFSSLFMLEEEIIMIIVGIIGTILVYFPFFCFELLFIKAELPWWGLFVPIYNVILFYSLCTGNGASCLVEIIPVGISFLGVITSSIGLITFANAINSIIGIVLLFKLGRRFGRSGILTVLFGFVIIPAIALSKRYQCEY